MTTHADGGHGGRPDDQHGGRRDVDRRVLGGAVAGQDGVTDLLVQCGEGGRAEDDLVIRLDRVAREDGRTEGGVRLGQQDRDGLAVDLRVGERVAGPCSHGPIAAQERADHGRDSVRCPES